jgi:hypothetical protein
MSKTYRHGSDKSSLAKIIERYIQGLALGLPPDDPLFDCTCVQPEFKLNQTQNIFQSENMRVAAALTNNLGGKLTFGNLNVPAKLNYLGGIEGQPGGTPRPLRNKF